MALPPVCMDVTYFDPITYFHTVVAKRPMAPGIADIEGSTHGHDVISVKAATNYLLKRGYPQSVISDILDNIKPTSFQYSYIGSTKEKGANRVIFGEAVNLVLDELPKEVIAKKVMVIDSESIDGAMKLLLYLMIR